MEQRNVDEFLMGFLELFSEFCVFSVFDSFRYLCKLSDQELRQSAARNMADLMWSTVKEPLDTTLCFDKESLDLAFKYFMSPTLTMRLAGLSQITVSNVSFVFDDCFVCLLDKHNTSEGLYVPLNAVLHRIFYIAFTIFFHL